MLPTTRENQGKISLVARQLLGKLCRRQRERASKQKKHESHTIK
jgi:hypothetical protein